MTTDITTHLQALREASVRLILPAIEDARARRLIFRNRRTGKHYARRNEVEVLADAVKDFMLEEIFK